MVGFDDGDGSVRPVPPFQLFMELLWSFTGGDPMAAVQDKRPHLYRGFAGVTLGSFQDSGLTEGENQYARYRNWF
ncbi:hypothetical protein [Desulfofundulus sp.]|uniref:hypothetical protein n=1 Tax=Desulfofundulus sp. TaxID=2282750 RepID=UPI003C7257A6